MIGLLVEVAEVAASLALHAWFRVVDPFLPDLILFEED